jgi:hypothetical protein
MTNKTPDPRVRDEVWRFMRDDLIPDAFEAWLYAGDEAEKTLGERGFLEAISINYSNPRQVADFKAYLRRILRPPFDCDCHLQPDVGSVMLGRWSSQRLEAVEREIGAIWWLHRMKCTVCGTIWKIAAEERIYDVWLLWRDSFPWPPEILTYHGLLMAAKDSGASVYYLDPGESIEIPAAIQSLAEETPGLACSTIAALLPVDEEIVRRHARDVALRHKLQIDLNA